MWLSVAFCSICMCLIGTFLYARSRPGITAANCRRLSLGIREAEVEALFGEKGEPGSVFVGWGDVCYSKEWRGDEVKVVIVFHKNAHTAIEGAYYPVLPNGTLGATHGLEAEESLLSRIWRWLRRSEQPQG